MAEEDPAINHKDQVNNPKDANADLIGDNKVFIHSKSWGTVVCIMLGIGKTNFFTLKIEKSCLVSKISHAMSIGDHDYKSKNWFSIFHPS